MLAASAKPTHARQAALAGPVRTMALQCSQGANRWAALSAPVPAERTAPPPAPPPPLPACGRQPAAHAVTECRWYVSSAGHSLRSQRRRLAVLAALQPQLATWLCAPPPLPQRPAFRRLSSIATVRWGSPGQAGWEHRRCSLLPTRLQQPAPAQLHLRHCCCMRVVGRKTAVCTATLYPC